MDIKTMRLKQKELQELQGLENTESFVEAPNGKRPRHLQLTDDLQDIVGMILTQPLDHQRCANASLQVSEPIPIALGDPAIPEGEGDGNEVAAAPAGCSESSDGSDVAVAPAGCPELSESSDDSEAQADLQVRRHRAMHALAFLEEPPTQARRPRLGTSRTCHDGKGHTHGDAHDRSSS